MHKVNLLPPAAIQRFRQKRLWKGWRKAILLATLTTAGTIAWGQSTASKQLHRQAAQATLVQHPQQMRKQSGELKAQLRDLQNYEQRQRNSRGQHSPLVVIAMLHQLKQTLAGQLQVKSLAFVDHVATQAAGTVGQPSGHVDLQLISLGSASCSHVMQWLRDTGLFANVSLDSSLERVDTASDTLQYTLRCDF